MAEDGDVEAPSFKVDFEIAFAAFLATAVLSYPQATTAYAVLKLLVIAMVGLTVVRRVQIGADSRDHLLAPAMLTEALVLLSSVSIVYVLFLAATPVVGSVAVHPTNASVIVLGATGAMFVFLSYRQAASHEWQANLVEAAVHSAEEEAGLSRLWMNYLRYVPVEMQANTAAKSGGEYQSRLYHYGDGEVWEAVRRDDSLVEARQRTSLKAAVAKHAPDIARDLKLALYELFLFSLATLGVGWYTGDVLFPLVVLVTVVLVTGSVASLYRRYGVGERDPTRRLLTRTHTVNLSVLVIHALFLL